MVNEKRAADSTTLANALERIVGNQASPADLQLLRTAITTGTLTLATGDGAVAVGGNADNSVIITGSVNISYQGNDAGHISEIYSEIVGQIESDRHDRALRDYFSALRRYSKHIPYLSLDEFRGGLPESLADVYVPLLVQTGEANDDQHEERGQRRTPIAIRELFQRLASSADSRPLFIRGNPGAGKSTLLRWIAMHAWDTPDEIGLSQRHLPIIVPMQRLAFAEGSSIGERLRDALGKAGELLLDEPLPDDFYTDWSRRVDAPWLLMLDGLDEVPSQVRAQFLRWLGDLLDDARERHLHVVVTSRPAGTDPMIEAKCDPYMLQPFDSEQQRQFADRWFGADGVPFLHELNEVEVGTLAGTPLVLAISAAVRKHDKKIPATRAALYARFVEIWLQEATLRSLTTEIGESYAENARMILDRLALAATEQPEANTLASLAHITIGCLREAFGTATDIAARKVLRALGQHSGLLVSHGEGFDWIHPTFREYLAATALSERYYSDEEIPGDLLDRWQLPEWRGVILFFLGIRSEIGSDGVSYLIDRILQRRDSHENPRAALLYVGSALAQGARVSPALETGIVQDLLDLSRITAVVPYQRDSDPAGNALTLLGTLRGREQVTRGLLTLATDTAVNRWIRIAAGDSLANLSQASDAATAFRQLARDPSVASATRIIAAKRLATLGCVDEAVEIIYGLGCDVKRHYETQLNAGCALAEYGYANQAATVLDALILRENVPFQVRVTAMTALQSINRGYDLIEPFSAIACEKSQPMSRRVDAVQLLVESGNKKSAPKILHRLAYDDQDAPGLRIQACSGLKRSDALPVLQEIGHDEAVDPEQRMAAGHLLAQWITGNDDIVDIMQSIVGNRNLDRSLRIRAAVELHNVFLRLFEDYTKRMGLPDYDAWAYPRREFPSTSLSSSFPIFSRGDYLPLRAIQHIEMDKDSRTARYLLEVISSWTILSQDDKLTLADRLAATISLVILGRNDSALATYLESVIRDEKMDTWMQANAAQALSWLRDSTEIPDATPDATPDAFFQFSPTDRQLLLYGWDADSGKPSDPIAPSAITTSVWDDDDDDKDDPDPKSDRDGVVELRSYTVTDNAGNTLKLAAKVVTGQSGSVVRIISTQYNGETTQQAPSNLMHVHWATDPSGKLTTLTQWFAARSLTDAQICFVQYDEKDNQSVIQAAWQGQVQMNTNPREWSEVGDALLTMALTKGAFQISDRHVRRV